MSPPAGVWTKACLKYEEDDTEQEKKAILKSVNSARSQNISTKDNPFQLHVLHAFMISNRGDLMILYNLALILRTAFNWNHSTSDVLPPCEFGKNKTSCCMSTEAAFKLVQSEFSSYITVFATNSWKSYSLSVLHIACHVRLALHKYHHEVFKSIACSHKQMYHELKRCTWAPEAWTCPGLL